VGVNYRLSVEPDAKPEDMQAIRDSLNEFNMRVTGDRNYRPFTICVRDDDNALKGGLLADVWGGWMHISYLWLDEPLRKHGIGKQLVDEAEAAAKTLGCYGIHLETFSFQALPFYKKLGYEVFAELPNFPLEHRFYFLRKIL
jgi:GNAT superfamily N-acetyltransferase